MLEIESQGTFGLTSTRLIALRIARNHKAQVEGAFTARANISATGASIVDGRNYAADGTTGKCGEVSGM